MTVAIYLKLKLKERFVKFPPEIMPCACCSKSLPYLEIATLKFSKMDTFSSVEVELTWIGLSNGAVEGQLLFKERRISGAW